MTHDEAIERVARLANGRYCGADVSKECNLEADGVMSTRYKVYISHMNDRPSGRKHYGWFYGESFDEAVSEAEKAVEECGFRDE